MGASQQPSNSKSRACVPLSLFTGSACLQPGICISMVNTARTRCDAVCNLFPGHLMCPSKLHVPRHPSILHRFIAKQVDPVTLKPAQDHYRQIATTTTFANFKRCLLTCIISMLASKQFAAQTAGESIRLSAIYIDERAERERKQCTSAVGGETRSRETSARSKRMIKLRRIRRRDEAATGFEDPSAYFLHS